MMIMKLHFQLPTPTTFLNTSDINSNGIDNANDSNKYDDNDNDNETRR